jgi:2-polyprenyl-6-methoxyphenol hydroxylase-like FAD-dependent oxidoreductase
VRAYQNGIRAIVFERDAGLDVRSRDWNMGLHWGAPVLKTLLPDEGWARIQKVQVDPTVPTKALDSLAFLNSKTGEELGAAEIDNFYRLKRSKLRAMLTENVADLKFGKKLVSIENSEDSKSITAKFEDGTSAIGMLIVGADGARSATRHIAVGTDAAISRRIPFAATFVQASFTREQATHLRSWHSLYLAGIHPKGQFSFFGIQDATDSTKPESWVFFFYISWPCSLEEQDKTRNWTNEQRLKQAKEFAKEYADPWKSAYEWLADDHPVWYAEMSDWDPGAEDHRWNNYEGRVTLAGDAAHTMTYQRGQGLNHSISDAGKLVQAVKSILDGSKEQKDAIAEYEKEMMERAGTEVRMSTQNTGMVHDWERALQSPVMRKGLKKG